MEDGRSGYGRHGNVQDPFREYRNLMDGMAHLAEDMAMFRRRKGGKGKCCRQEVRGWRV